MHAHTCSTFALLSGFVLLLLLSSTSWGSIIPNPTSPSSLYRRRVLNVQNDTSIEIRGHGGSGSTSFTIAVPGVGRMVSWKLISLAVLYEHNEIDPRSLKTIKVSTHFTFDPMPEPVPKFWHIKKKEYRVVFLDHPHHNENDQIEYVVGVYGVKRTLLEQDRKIVTYKDGNDDIAWGQVTTPVCQPIPGPFKPIMTDERARTAIYAALKLQAGR